MKVRDGVESLSSSLKMSLEESLTKLDATLVERMTVPMKLLLDDYTHVAGSHGTAATDPNCELMYRLLGTAWIGPWGSCLPWLLPPSSIESREGKTKVILRIPQSRVRHFLTDAALYSPEMRGVKITSAILRLGPDRIIQSLDSDFACNISLYYKHARKLEEQTDTLRCPLFFDSPLRVLPLFVANTPLPEIEYELSGEVSPETIRFLTKFISSVGETDTEASKIIVQHLPSFATFRKTVSEIDKPVFIDVSTKDGKLARTLYFRVISNNSEDEPNAIISVELIGPSPRFLSLLGHAWPGSICRKYFKSDFTKEPADTTPYYVLPFPVNPTGNTADYGLQIFPGSQLQVELNIIEGEVTIEVCVETFERVTWKR